MGALYLVFEPAELSAVRRDTTDHVWTTGELLAYRVPVEFLDQLRTIEHLFPKM